MVSIRPSTGSSFQAPNTTGRRRVAPLLGTATLRKLVDAVRDARAQQ